MDAVHGSADDWRPRCDNCRRPIVAVTLRIIFSDTLFFDVCEECCPIPGTDEFHVVVAQLIGGDKSLN